MDAAWDSLYNMWNYTVALLPRIGVALVVFVIFFFIARGVRSIVRRLSWRNGHPTGLGMVLGRLSQWTLVLIGFLIGTTIVFPSLKADDLFQLLGIGSVAIGFAFRDILQNFLAGILILLTRPFVIGDQIIFGEYEGTVEEIETRATFIRTYDGRRVVIPNAQLFTGSVEVNTAYDVRRLEYDIGIGYGDDIETARGLILDAMRGVDGVLHDPAPDAIVVELAASSVNIRARWWIRPPRRADALDLQDKVITTIKNTLVANGIDLPYPTQQILFHDQTEEIDGDRRRQREGWPAGDGDVPQPRSIGGALRRLAESGNSDGHDVRAGNTRERHPATGTD